MDMENIDFAKLKEAVKALNEVEGLLDKGGLKNIKTVAVKKEAMVALFTASIEKLSEIGEEEEIPELCVNMYNEIHGDEGTEEEETEEEETEEEETEEEEEEKAPKEKKEKVTKAPKEKKEKVTKAPKEKKEKISKEKKERAKSRYGCWLSAISGQLDEMMGDGITVGEIEKELNIPYSRISSHIKSLKDRGLTVMIKENQDPKKTEIKVKEDKL